MIPSVYYFTAFKDTDKCKVCLINSDKTVEEILRWSRYSDVQDEDKVIHREEWGSEFYCAESDYEPRDANMGAFKNKEILVEWKAPYPYHVIGTHAIIFKEDDERLLVLIDFGQQVRAFGCPVKLKEDIRKYSDYELSWGPGFTIHGPIELIKTSNQGGE